MPEGGDAYMLKAILHDWDDEEATAILRACRRAMPDSGTLLVIERDLGPANEQPQAKLSDLNMLVILGGRERTARRIRGPVRRRRVPAHGRHADGVGLRVFEAMRGLTEPRSRACTMVAPPGAT